MNLKAAALGLTALSLIACETESVNPRSIDGQVYKNSAVGLTITFPIDWVITPDQKFGSVTADIVALGLPVQDFTPNMNVIIVPHSGPAEMTDVLATLKPQLEAHYAD